MTTDSAALRQLLNEATPGPWWDNAIGTGIHAANDPGGPSVAYEVRSTYNRRLIVAAVNALPALLDERDRLREALRPFKRLADLTDDLRRDMADGIATAGGGISWAELDAARTALAQSEEPPHVLVDGECILPLCPRCAQSEEARP